MVFGLPGEFKAMIEDTIDTEEEATAHLLLDPNGLSSRNLKSQSIRT
jgi:hypothetical protein